jgi:hypothetical protein
MTAALSQALNYIEEHSEPELLEMALKHTSSNAWISALCKKAHHDGVTVACSLYKDLSRACSPPAWSGDAFRSSSSN